MTRTRAHVLDDLAVHAAALAALAADPLLAPDERRTLERDADALAARISAWRNRGT